MGTVLSEHTYPQIDEIDKHSTTLQSSASSLNSDLPLVSRIRALLLSRNNNYPPRTPCPSPEFGTPSRTTYTSGRSEPKSRSGSSSLGKNNLRKTALLRRASTASVVMSDAELAGSFDGVLRSQSTLHPPSSPVPPAQSLDIDIVKAILKVEQSLLDHVIGEDTTREAFIQNLSAIRSEKRRYSQIPSPPIVRAVTVSRPRLIGDYDNLRRSVPPSLSSTSTSSSSPSSPLIPLMDYDESVTTKVSVTYDNQEENEKIASSNTVAPLVVRRKPRRLSLSSYRNPPSPFSHSQNLPAFKALQDTNSVQGSVRRFASSPLAGYLNISGVNDVSSLTSLDHRSACSVTYVSGLDSSITSSPLSIQEKRRFKTRKQKWLKRNALYPPIIPVRRRKVANQSPPLGTSMQSYSITSKSMVDSPSIYSQPERSISQTPSREFGAKDSSTRIQEGDVGDEATLKGIPLSMVNANISHSALNNSQCSPSNGFEPALSDTRKASSAPNLHIATQQEILDLMQKTKHAKAALFAPSKDRQQSWDLQSAQEWVSQFLRKSFSKDNLQVQDRNLTARTVRNSQSYFEQYQNKKELRGGLSPLFNDGGRSRIPSQDVERLNQRVLASFKNDRLEQVVTELESVLEEALTMAIEAADTNDIELQKELQDITASLKSTELAHDTKKPEAGLVSTQIQPESPQSEVTKPVPPRKMKRIVQSESYDEAQFHKLIQDYHRTLTKLHDPNTIKSRRHSVSTDSQISKLAIANPKDVSSRQDMTRAEMPIMLRVNTSPSVSPRGLGIAQSQQGALKPLGPNLVGSSSFPVAGHSAHAPHTPHTHAITYNENSSGQSSSDWKAPSDWDRRTPGCNPVQSYDWAIGGPNGIKPFTALTDFDEKMKPPDRVAPLVPSTAQDSSREQQYSLVRSRRPTSADIKAYVLTYKEPPLQQRRSSRMKSMPEIEEDYDSSDISIPEDLFSEDDYVADFEDNNQNSRLLVDGSKTRAGSKGPAVGRTDFVPGSLVDVEVKEEKSDPQIEEIKRNTSRRDTKLASNDFYKHRHLSFRGRAAFSLYKSHKRAPIARDWSKERKRFVASVTCISTALVGLIIGIYAGEVPAIQYALVDEHHRYTYLGNVFLYLGLALSNIMFWPLPLLHGRKPYTISAMVVALPLLFPQALVVTQQRDPDNFLFRIGLLLPRFIAGIALGFAQTNFFGVLLDVFGSSLMSANPHQEIVNPYDVRRHGGGMGAWLSIWTWCYIGSIGVGFFVGALITEWLNVAWGFWIAIFCTVVVILINVVAPETRRSSYRRSMAEVRKGNDVSRRIARGEIMMHLYSTGPKHWWQEMLAGWVLCIRLCGQIGFSIVVIYQAWIYGQVVMVMILLGALTSKYYQLHPHAVALCVASFPLGALVAIPFQKASLFSRARHRPQRSDSMTYQTGVVWTSHMARRTTFMVLLPLAGLAYTLSSTGVKIPLALPVLFSALIGFLSNLALSECAGMLMEDYDTSDLQPGMTGRPRTAVSDEDSKRRTNFSCFPRVTAAFAIVQSLSFCFAAAATACGGNVERHLGAQYSTAVVAGVLLFLTLSLVVALLRVKEVQMVPSKRVPTAILSGPGDDLPVIIGSPSGTARRVSLLELGNMTRWSEIRRRNKLLK